MRLGARFDMAKPSKQPEKPSQVRIIAGQYRRRLVGFIAAEGLRPTPDRVRETVFNWLGDDLINARVLDCCAGSGVLGFEALSRGARQVICVEPNRQQRRQLTNTQASLGIAPQQFIIYQQTIEDALTTLPKNECFDVVFIDPPYRLNLWNSIVNALIHHQLIHPHTLLYIEGDQPHDVILKGCLHVLDTVKYKKMGQVWAGIYTTKKPI